MKFNKSAFSQRVKLLSLKVRKVSTSGQIPLTRKPLKMKGKAAKATPLSPKASGSSKSGPGQRKRSAKLKLQP